MRRSTYLLFMLSFFLTCHKPAEDFSIECIGDHQARLIRGGCEAYVFQLIAPSVLTQAVWKDIFTKKEYTNVLSVLNYCDDTPESKMLQSLSNGDLVTMTLTPTEERCLILCFAFEDAPDKSYKASAISICAK